ncbi:MAG: hypothetical protein ABSB74_19375 [Tepidisphaeraceae bacterium]
MLQMTPEKSDQTRNHWGQWLRLRWRFLGFRRIGDLSTSLGCCPDLVTRWLRSEFPPDSIRKGFDTALIGALRTDRWTLFNSYTTVAPEDAPIVDPPRDTDAVGVHNKILLASKRAAI